MELDIYGGYIADDEETYLCIGFTEKKEHAVLAPFYSDDEDCAPMIQKGDLLVVQHPFNGGWLKKLQDFKVHVPFELI